ncbi:MAG: aminopeptidase P family protein [Chloroflexi bacterium]|nr:aminopeptidase P family protein [Chloroflexota bacterium]
MNKRLEKLREALQEKELDAILISTDENRRYMSGFSGSAGYLLISQNDAVLATDFRYVEQAGRQAPDFRVERIAGGHAWLPKLTAEIGVKRVGFESQQMTYSAYTLLQKAIEDAEGSQKPEMVSTAGIVERLRAFKDADELKLLARAIEIGDEAFELVAPTIEAGITEREIAWELEKAMRERGAEKIGYDIIVAAGANGALPHHRAGDKVVEDGDAIVIDMGAMYEGYTGDMTRTIIVGEADETFLKVYDTVLRAQLEAEDKARAGMTGKEVDAIARDIIAEAGYGDAFGHSLGHGIGLEVHEEPRISAQSDQVLEDGMVFTIEPGIYLSGWGGVRIEDNVVMENGRVRIMTRSHKRASAR